MRRRNLAIPVKLWALACAILGISLTANTVLTCVLTLTGFAYLAAQRNWWLLRSFGAFFALLAVLLYLIRFHGLHMVVFSEFYVLMFWNLSPVFIVGWDLITTPPGEIAAFLSRIHMPSSVILGLLVMFRFFPTMKVEIRSVGRSMRNRGLTAPAQLLCHPAASCEYVAVPLQISSPFPLWRGAPKRRAGAAVITEKTLMLQTGPGLPAGQSLRRHFSGWEVCEYDTA